MVCPENMRSPQCTLPAPPVTTPISALPIQEPITGFGFMRHFTSSVGGRDVASKNHVRKKNTVPHVQNHLGKRQHEAKIHVPHQSTAPPRRPLVHCALLPSRALGSRKQSARWSNWRMLHEMATRPSGLRLKFGLHGAILLGVLSKQNIQRCGYQKLPVPKPQTLTNIKRQRRLGLSCTGPCLTHLCNTISASAFVSLLVPSYSLDNMP